LDECDLQLAGQFVEKYPHHLIDICNPEDTYSAFDFVHDANKQIDKLTAEAQKTKPRLASHDHQVLIQSHIITSNNNGSFDI
jgi:hypothetical protein